MLIDEKNSNEKNKKLKKKLKKQVASDRTQEL